jgi:enamine deaminase RidA (YjgF/YER057c/UK114 family)
MVHKEYASPAGLYKQPHQTFTRVIKVKSPGSLIFISAMVPLDDEGKLVGLGNVELQVRQAMHNLKACLTSVGCTMDDVVKLTWYVTNIKRDYDAIIEARKKHLGEKPPTSTMVGIRDIGPERIPGILVEIDAIAVSD